MHEAKWLVCFNAVPYIGQYLLVGLRNYVFMHGEPESGLEITGIVPEGMDVVYLCEIILRFALVSISLLY